MEKATYVSIWDGCTPIESSCDYDRETKTVSNIETVDVDKMDIDICTDEFVLLSDGTEVRDFINADV
jgi:hypothetical protein